MVSILKNYERFMNETDEELLFRLGGVREHDGLNWIEFGKVMNELTGQEFTESKWRKQYSTFEKMFNANKKNLVGAEYVNGIDEKQIEFEKAKYKFYDQRTAYNKLIRSRSRQEELNEIILSAISSDNLPRLDYEPCQCEKSDNDLLVSINDIHYGADINNAWNVYNSDICKNRFNEYLDKIIEIQKLHNSENCIVWCNGDEISGSIHYDLVVSNKENVIEQVTGVSELISEFLSVLSKYFKTVRYVCVAGNHSRLGEKNNSVMKERLDDLVEWYLRARLQNFENILFDDYDKIDQTMYLVNIRGLNYGGIHGDYDRGLEKILSVQNMMGKKVYAMLTAHMHHNKTDKVQGITVIMSGSLMGMDDFCVQKRIFGKPEQMVSVVGKNGIICNYDVQFN